MAESLACDREHPFSARLWDSISDIYGAILAHPFITGLTDGTLPEESFAFYVIQDALYLRDYARALAAVGSRAPTAGAMRMFASHAADAIAAELELHGALLASWEFPGKRLSAPSPPRRTSAYTSYLLATVRGGSYAEAVGAVLPCYWIYCGGRQGAAAPRIARSALPAVDRHLRRGRVRRGRRVTSSRTRSRFRRPFRVQRRPQCAATSGPPAATSGCSGRWGMPWNPGRSKPAMLGLR